MCDTIYLPDDTEVDTINKLEAAFGKPVNDYHPWPETLDDPADESGPATKDCCLCHVDLRTYLTDVGATWIDDPDWYGDILVQAMPPTIDTP